MAEIRIFQDEKAWTEAAAQFFVAQASESLRERGRYTVALSGGRTPEPVYGSLGSGKISECLDWDQIHLFWGDERHVLPDHPDSNYRMVRETLLEPLNIPEKNVHRVPTELDPWLAAFIYEEELRGFFQSEYPIFDLILLGMGEDGHTASLFPQSAGLHEKKRWFIANYAPTRRTWRLTLTLPAINAARNVAVFIRGTSKSKKLKEVLEGPRCPEDNPIQFVKPKEGKLIWFLDRDAASNLTCYNGKS